MQDGEQLVIAVDPQDRATGLVDKVTAHRKGLLHRAFSIFVFDGAGRLLLQRRAAAKYHSGGLWSNTCCSHPRAGESLLDAAHRRLREEMGFDCPLQAVFGFVYRAELDGGMVEHEFDHVVIGRFREGPDPDVREVDDWKWEGVPAIRSCSRKIPRRSPRGSSPPSRGCWLAVFRSDESGRWAARFDGRARAWR